jgi:quinol monooxygenase YgiN
MPHEKVVRLLQVKVLPQWREEVLQAVRENKLPTRADKGVEAYYQTVRKDDPNTLLFFAVFASQDAYDSHIQQEHAKRTFAAFQGKLAEEPVRTELVELE